MKLRSLLAVVAAAFVVGCAGTTPDDTESSDNGYETVGEADSGSGQKADNIKNKEVAWKAERDIAIQGTSHRGTAEVVTTSPKVQVRSQGIIVGVDELPAELNIKADEGLVSTKEMNFVAYWRPDRDTDWKQLKFEGTRTRTRDIQRDRCDGMAGAGQDDCWYEEEYTEEYNFWRFSQMTLGEDEIEFGEERFPNHLAKHDYFELRIVPIPFGKLIGLEGTYNYELTAECFGAACTPAFRN